MNKIRKPNSALQGAPLSGASVISDPDRHPHLVKLLDAIREKGGKYMERRIQCAMDEYAKYFDPEKEWASQFKDLFFYRFNGDANKFWQLLERIAKKNSAVFKSRDISCMNQLNLPENSYRAARADKYHCILKDRLFWDEIMILKLKETGNFTPSVQPNKTNKSPKNISGTMTENTKFEKLLSYHEMLQKPIRRIQSISNRNIPNNENDPNYSANHETARQIFRDYRSGKLIVVGDYFVMLSPLFDSLVSLLCLKKQAMEDYALAVGDQDKFIYIYNTKQRKKYYFPFAPKSKYKDFDCGLPELKTTKPSVYEDVKNDGYNFFHQCYPNGVVDVFVLPFKDKIGASKTLKKSYSDYEFVIVANADYKTLISNNPTAIISLVQKGREMLYGGGFTGKKSTERTGIDWTNGEEINEERLSKVFNFRSIMFRRINASDKKKALTDIFNAFSDLEYIINGCVEHPSDKGVVSHGRVLGIVLGAPKEGNAMAYYTPISKNLNFTTKEGAGTLAHEWFHSLDNHLADLYFDKNYPFKYLTEGYNMRLLAEKNRIDLYDLLEKWDGTTLRSLDMYAASVKKDKRRKTGKYWSKPVEATARCFEFYCSEKLKDKGITNDFLVQVGKSDLYPSENDKPKVMDFFDKFFGMLRVENKGLNIQYLYGSSPEIPEIENTVSAELSAKIPATEADRRSFLESNLQQFVGTEIFNKYFNANIFTLKKSLSEICKWAAKSKESVIAALNFDSVIANAVKVKEDAAKPNKQTKELYFVKMYIMHCIIKGLGTAKLTVGERKNGKKITYCITALQIEKSGEVGTCSSVASPLTSELDSEVQRKDNKENANTKEMRQNLLGKIGEASPISPLLLSLIELLQLRTGKTSSKKTPPPSAADIIAMLDSHEFSGEPYTDADKEILRQYQGKGGKAKQYGADTGILNQYYTPIWVCEYMYQLAKHYGYQGGNILEPSAATGNMLYPFYSRGDYKHIDAFEIDNITAKICKILYPDTEVFNQYFETAFLEYPRFASKARKSWLKNAPYDLVIGNPPYGIHKNLYSGYFTGKDHFQQIEMFFIYKGLQLLRPGGLLIYITSTNFMSTGMKTYATAKRLIGEIADFKDAYRLPSVFDNTPICTDIIVLQKK